MGIIAGIILAILLIMLFNESGAGLIILAAIAFGLIFDNFFTTRKIAEDLEEIKKKLGVKNEEGTEAVYMNDEEIEKEHMERTDENRFVELSEIDKGIEQELLEFAAKEEEATGEKDSENGGKR